MAASRGAEIRCFPRLFESLLNNFDQNLIAQFVHENCLPDCTFELNLYNGEDAAEFSDQSAPSCTPKKTYFFNNNNVVKLLLQIHSAIPDFLMFIHDSQFLSKLSGVQLVCKFSVSGFAIFDSDIDIQTSNLASSPKHFQQLYQASASIQNSSSFTSNMSSSSSDTNSSKRGGISFKGDMTSHSAHNDSTKRKYKNTVGKYVDSKHLDNAFEAIKKTKDTNSVKSRKLSSDQTSSSTVNVGISLDQQDNYRIRSMSVDTTESGMFGGRLNNYRNPPSISLKENHEALSFDQQEANTPCPRGCSSSGSQPANTSSLGALRDESMQPLTTSFSYDQLLAIGSSLSPTAYGLVSNDNSFTRSTSTYRSNPEHISASASFSSNPFSVTSISSSSASVDVMPSLFVSAPRSVESGGILKVIVQEETNKIISVVITAFCTSPYS